MDNVINLEKKRLLNDTEARGFVFGYLVQSIGQAKMTEIIFNQLPQSEQNRIAFMAKSQGVL